MKTAQRRASTSVDVSLESGHPLVTWSLGHRVRLPPAAQDIADVLGRERALFLIGQLPTCLVKDSGKSATAKRVILYVPKRLKPDHRLVRILGWNDAERLVQAFGGEILCPPTLVNVLYIPFRDKAIVQMAANGISVQVLAEWFGLSDRRVSQLLETPKEASPTTNDNHPGLFVQRVAG